ncbi:nitrogen fixation protein NifW [Vibrio hippocampi]|uniref:Nitrogenase-stabilizing/protective protein NifW n=1 Tax=Vibrio hippocampi TaxID=654686 RepID=A0ABM8ZM02_9VIBR|nr:nitrogen fixation protein NifW [Vibrio hippocampi]CAH0529552.1 hypothetical protein VHP8226_03306 [Vibrio hippocampi]
MASTKTLSETIAEFTCIEDALRYFEIEFDSKFIDEYRQPLTKTFAGYLLLQKPEDWFEGRRALKNAYCKIQRGRLDKHSRSACRGCTSCQRR